MLRVNDNGGDLAGIVAPGKENAAPEHPWPAGDGLRRGGGWFDRGIATFRPYPVYTTLDVMAAAIRAEANNGFCRTVAGRLDAVAKARLARMLVVDPVSRRSEFDRVKDVAKAASLGRFKERLDLLESIDAIGPTGVWLDGVALAENLIRAAHAAC